MSRSTSPAPVFTSTPPLSQQIVNLSESASSLPSMQVFPGVAVSSPSPARPPLSIFEQPRTVEQNDPTSTLPPLAGTPPSVVRYLGENRPYASERVRAVVEQAPEVSEGSGYGTYVVDSMKKVGGHIANAPYHIYSARESVGTTVSQIPQNVSADDIIDGVKNFGSAAANRVRMPGTYASDPADNVYYEVDGGMPGAGRLQVVAGPVQSAAGHVQTAAGHVGRSAYEFGGAANQNVLRPGAKHAWNGFDWLARTLHKGGQNIAEGVSAGAEITTDGLENGNVGVMFLICGIFGLSMLVLIPIWDAASLLNNPEWMYLYGMALPVLLIVCSILIPLAFVAAVILLLKYGRGTESRSEQTFFSAAILFVLLLGSLLVTFSSPISQNALTGASAFTTGCKTSLMTRPLYLESEKLQKLRGSAACSKEWSITQCKGFKENQESRVLMKMEEHLKCAGFCWDPHVEKAGSSPAKKKFLLQLESQELGKRRASSDVTTGIASMTANVNGTDRASDYYPPALFSKVKYAASCNAMAARDMSNFVGDMSKQLKYEGFFLIAAAVLQGFLMIVGLVTKKEQASLQQAAKRGQQSAAAMADYGATQAQGGSLPMTVGAGDFRRRQFAQ